MNNTQNSLDRADSSVALDRRQVLKAGIALAALSLMSCSAAPTKAPAGQPTNEITPTQSPLDSTLSGRRRLGSLEVSSVGIGVQNMSRTYQTTIPTRSEMINIIRTAFDHGVTFFDAAEAYGPFEVERILGEAVEPFREKVVIASKFGWDLDLKTGQMRRGTQ